ncbi:MAG: KH domain-containing protein [Bacilli bacterium]|nr:KH domain-containing protein [Bacilli bacterium]
MVELTEFLVKSLVKDPDSVSVKKFEDEEDVVTIQVLVDESDMGAVIGKNGMIINSIRTIVRASSYMNGEPRVNINIDSF